MLIRLLQYLKLLPRNCTVLGTTLRVQLYYGRVGVVEYEYIYILHVHTRNVVDHCTQTAGSRLSSRNSYFVLHAKQTTSHRYQSVLHE